MIRQLDIDQQLTKQQPEQQQEQQRRKESQNYQVTFLLFPYQKARKLLVEERPRKDKRKKGSQKWKKMHCIYNK